MPHQTKIATCSYCGRRQMLRLTAHDGHELACGACGAPLHEMKWLKLPDERRAPPKRGPKRPEHHEYGTPDRKKRSKRKKKRKTFWEKAMEEAFDVIEDIFD